MKIVITHIIAYSDLFIETGYNEIESAKKLVTLIENECKKFCNAYYPSFEIELDISYTDVSLFNTNVEIYENDNLTFYPEISLYSLTEEIDFMIEDIYNSHSWAVKE